MRPSYLAKDSDDIAYITNSNLKKLMPDIGYIDPEKYNYLYKSDLHFILSLKELHVLYTLREFYKGSYNEIRSTYHKSLNFVYDNKPPAFHKDGQCKYLLAEYTNYAIPGEIKLRGLEQIMKYKNFFVEYARLLSEKPDVFEIKINSQFKTTEKITILKISHQNSGHGELNDVSLSAIEDKIDTLLQSAKAYRNSSKETLDIIDRLGFGPAKSKEAQDPNNPLHKWHYEFKSRLKQLLEKFFKEKFNPDMDISKSFLISTGFRPCLHCCKDI